MITVIADTPQVQCGSTRVGETITVTSVHEIVARNTGDSREIVDVACTLNDTSGKIDVFQSSYTLEPGESVRLLDDKGEVIKLRLRVSYNRPGRYEVSAKTSVTGAIPNSILKRNSCFVEVAYFPALEVMGRRSEVSEEIFNREGQEDS